MEEAHDIVAMREHEPWGVDVTYAHAERTDSSGLAPITLHKLFADRVAVLGSEVCKNSAARPHGTNAPECPKQGR